MAEVCFVFKFEEHLYGTSDPVTELGEHWGKRIFEIVIANVANSVKPGGLKGTDLRTMGRILFKLDETPANYLVLETSEIELLRDLLMSDQATVPQAQIRYLMRLRAELEKALKPQSAS